MTVCRPDEALPISGDDYPFRLEVTPQARREIGHAIAREEHHEPRISFGCGDVTATLQRADDPPDRLHYRRPNNVTATHGRHRLE